MPENRTPPAESEPGGAEQLRGRLAECAKLLRSTHHLDPEAQQVLADLVEELADSLEATSEGASVHLAETSAHLVHALHAQQEASLLTAARHRLEAVAARAEAEAPVAAGVVRKFIDALAGIGI